MGADETLIPLDVPPVWAVSVIVAGVEIEEIELLGLGPQPTQASVYERPREGWHGRVPIPAPYTADDWWELRTVARMDATLRRAMGEFQRPAKTG